jgi:signal peptidase I
MPTLLTFESVETDFISRVASVLNKVAIGVRLVSSILFGLVFLFAATLLAYGVITNGRQPSFFGRQVFVVTSGSMAPEIETGDVIFTKSITTTTQNQLRIGDVVTFRAPSNETLLVTHRIAEISFDNTGSQVLVTKGDANQSDDLTSIPVSNVVGVYESRIPRIGFLMNTKEIQFLILFLGLTASSAHFASKIFFSLITPLKKVTQ